jgi:hypothetical protein
VFISWQDVQNLSVSAILRPPMKLPVNAMPTMKAISPPAGIPSKNQRCGRRHSHAANPRRAGSGEFTSILSMQP